MSSTISAPPQANSVSDSEATIRQRWISGEAKHTRLPVHGSSLVTSLIIHQGSIISASEDGTINMYAAASGKLVRTLKGHAGGIWSLAVAEDTLVSGSTDHTVRVWDMPTGRCTHVFGGHKGTVRALRIAQPMWVDVKDKSGETVRELWPKRPLIVSGSRDHNLRVWSLPKKGESDGNCCTEEGDPSEVTPENNPHHQRRLRGHTQAIRDHAVHGRTLVSGSYDFFSIALDGERNIAYSGSMDCTVRVWDLLRGQCKYTLTGHTSVVGLLRVSPSYLVSASADATLRVWNPDTGELLHILPTGGPGTTVVCLHHDEEKILSGSKGALWMWDIRTGAGIRGLLQGAMDVSQAVFEGQWCAAATNKDSATYLDIWDYGSQSA
ncbi:uncharacterized protein FIBRA_01641 [Fibroporia radiculosa]|uniref:Uncharacterized protein n=1 Tax=Fibroporia radiculosa TaxID=599839 RepID=J4HTN3_9APHY|nr:uncharacterized protein FIBRA_01641 [Fibroporia radiculosa]CCL99622.1 predicted protein [Fibroporia radiculosa]